MHSIPGKSSTSFLLPPVQCEETVLQQLLEKAEAESPSEDAQPANNAAASQKDSTVPAQEEPLMLGALPCKFGKHGLN